MSAHLMPNLARNIQFLRDCARAPSNEWPSYEKALRELPRVGVEGGDAAMWLCASVRSFIKNLANFRPESEASQRQVMLDLSDILQCEFNARYQPPYYLKADK